LPQRTYKSHRVLIGLEVHVQLATKSKMFTAAANAATNFGAEPNTLVDEQVLGLPGTLPVMNKRAVEYSIMVGLALGCKIATHTKWDRKSYYYPDLPKNYQISQYDLPLCFEGEFELSSAEPASAGGHITQKIRIRRAHLEEDAGKLLHEAPGGFHIDHSIVDLNRAGTPLLEIVTEPDLSDAKQVAAFGQQLQKLVQFLGVSEGQMQMGHMRFEPNINVHITDENGNVHKTAITEIKNLNSFSVLERATDFEIARQIRQWQETGTLGKKSTYGWDEATQSTFHQRDKEEANDYRYFPDPDLMPVEVSEYWLANLKSQIGELPAARRKRYIESVGLSSAEADILAGDRATGDFFEQTMRAGASAKRASNLVINVLATLANEKNSRVSELGIEAAQVAKVAAMMDANQIAAASALPLLRAIPGTEGENVETTAQDLGLLQSSDTGAVDAAINAVLAQNPKPVADYLAGKDAALGSLVGMVMKSSKGLNPKLVRERLKAKLG
jgi:aspartyl-tRNA(Asn)/glutamyl-tRNA(Gln) amidotransferase subunit B